MPPPPEAASSRPSRPRVFDPPPAPPAELGASYVDRDICPGECCTYREWTATAAVDVVAEPGGTRVVARIAPGEKIVAETGEVHLVPRPALVRRARVIGDEGGEGGTASSSVSLAPGDVLWVLAPLGEGWSRAWFRGKVYAADTSFMWSNPCPAPETECWLSADEDDLGPQRWWVRVRTSAGVVGWVDNTDDVLTGYDACA